MDSKTLKQLFERTLWAVRSVRPCTRVGRRRHDEPGNPPDGASVPVKSWAGERKISAFRCLIYPVSTHHRLCRHTRGSDMAQVTEVDYTLKLWSGEVTTQITILAQATEVD